MLPFLMSQSSSLPSSWPNITILVTSAQGVLIEGWIPTTLLGIKEGGRVPLEHKKWSLKGLWTKVGLPIPNRVWRSPAFTTDLQITEISSPVENVCFKG